MNVEWIDVKGRYMTQRIQIDTDSKRSGTSEAHNLLQYN